MRKKKERKEKGSISRTMKSLVPCHTVFSFVAKEGRHHALYICRESFQATER